MVSKRECSFELIRILASFIVVCLHTSSYYINHGNINKLPLLIKCFLQDAVPLFWFIMGWFLFHGNKKFLTIFKKTIVNICLPSFIIMLISQILSPWLKNEVDIWTCLQHPSVDTINLFSNIFKWKASMTLCGHLWYIFSYLKVILWYPLISSICISNLEARKKRYYLILLSLIATGINDIQQFYTLPIGQISPYYILDNSLFYVILGYEIRENLHSILKYKARFLIGSLITYLCANIARFFLTIRLYQVNPKNDYFMHINSIDSTMSSVALFIFLITLLSDVNFTEKVECCINFISSKTFFIYLIHRGIYEKFNAMGLRTFIYSLSNHTFYAEIFVMLLYAGLIYIISFLMSCIIHSLIKTTKCFKKSGLYGT